MGKGGVTHKCLLMNHTDSNMLTVIDMVTGHVSSSEVPHMEAVDRIYPGPNLADPYIKFDGDGGRVASYLGDGQVGDVAFDPTPAIVGNYTPYTPQGLYKFYSDTWIRIGRNTCLWPKVNNDPSSGFDLKMNDGTLILSSNTAMMPEIDYVASAPGLTVFASSDPGHVGTQYTVDVNSGYLSYGEYLGTDICINFFVDGRIFAIGQVWIENGMSHFLVEFEYNSVTDKLVAISSTEISNSPTNQNWVNSYNTFVKEDGTIILRTNWNAPAELDFNTKVLTIYPGDTFEARYGINNFWDVAKALAHNSTIDFMGDWQTLTSESTYSDCRLYGLPVIKIDIDLNQTGYRTNPLPELPEVNSTNFFIGASSTNLDSSGYRVWSIDTYRDSDGVDHLVNKIVIGNVNTLSAQVFDISSIRDGIDSKLADFNLRDAIVLDKAAYDVSGNITSEGSPAGTDVILFDNASLRIVGRTKSDPVTGQYYFRCWTSGKKSILAVSPITGGLRIAAERDPIAVT